VPAAAAAAQLPDPNLSTVELDPQSSVLSGLQTCPAGVGEPFEYIKITVYDAMAVPIPELPASDFEFTVVGGEVSFYPAPFSPKTTRNALPHALSLA
jgi:hypothetical protein